MQVGDIVKSLAGRDKDEYFLVIKVDKLRAAIVDGKIHSIQNAKEKNVKHLQTIFPTTDNEIVERIQSGKPVGNERLKQYIKSHTKQI